jgi:hypothetical protein
VLLKVGLKSVVEEGWIEEGSGATVGELLIAIAMIS